MEERAKKDKTVYQDLTLVQAQNQAPILSDVQCRSNQTLTWGQFIRTKTQETFQKANLGQHKVRTESVGLSIQDYTSEKVSF